MARLGGVGALSVTAALGVAGFVLSQTGGAASGSPSVPSSTAAEGAVPTTGPGVTTTSSVSPATVAARPVAVPATMTTRHVTVGPNGFGHLSGSCPSVDGVVLGPVEVWVVGDQVVRIDTGITGTDWTYDWQAPSTADPIALHVWCGDPTAAGLGFPSDQEVVVVFVAQQATTTVAAGDGGSGALEPLPGTA
jgi:hypothetical protein